MSSLDFFPLTQGVRTVIPAPSGYVVDFDNPARDTEIVARIYGCYVVGLFLALVFLLQHLYVKIYLGRNLDASTATVGDGLTCTHAWEITIEQFNQWQKRFFIASVLYIPTTGAAKLSLLLFYRKLSPATWWLRGCNVAIFCLGIYTVGVFCAMIFTCQPIAKSWDVLILDGQCLDRPALYLSFAALQILTDLILCIMPVPMISGLQMPTKQKIGVIAMFVVASSTLVVSCMRLVELIPVLSDMDQTWRMGKSVMLICIEGPLMIVCATFPTVRRFVTSIDGSRMSKSKGTNEDQKRVYVLGYKLKTFGAGSTRKRLDTFGMTVDHNMDDSENLAIEYLGNSESAQAKPNITANGHGDDASSRSSVPDNTFNVEVSTWDSRQIGGIDECEAAGILPVRSQIVPCKNTPKNRESR